MRYSRSETTGMQSIGHCNNKELILSTVYHVDNTCYDRIYPAYIIENESKVFQPFFVNHVNAQCIPCDESHQETFVEAKIIDDTLNIKYNDCAVQDVAGFSQPMITYCQVIKPEEGSSLGISFQRGTNNMIHIRQIDPDSPFARPGCLHPGDEVIAINGICSNKFLTNELFEIPTSSNSNNISITVWNPNGVQNTFMNSVQVPTCDDRLGIMLQNKSQYNGRLFVHNISDGGAFYHSLLGPGHQLVMVNNVPCSYLPSNSAVQLLHNTNATTTSNHTEIKYHHKNILSRIPNGCNKDVATVVSQEPVLKNNKGEARVKLWILFRKIGLILR